MFTYTLNNGTRIPWLGYGTGTALYKQDASDLVRQAIDHGMTHLDGAQMYCNEDSLGKGIKLSGKPRNELYITTKLDIPPKGQSVKDTLVNSLKHLGLDYVDLFLVHDPTPYQKEDNLKDVWKQMEAINDEGLAKTVGVSNFKVEDLQEILPEARIIPAVNQIELHPYVWKAAKPIVDFCQEKGIRIAAYGGQTPVVRIPDGPLKDILPKIRERLEKAHGSSVSDNQVLVKWLLHKGAIVITTSSKTSRIKDFMDAEKVPDLTEEEIKAIDEAGSQVHHRIFMRHIFGE